MVVNQGIYGVLLLVVTLDSCTVAIAVLFVILRSVNSHILVVISFTLHYRIFSLAMFF